MSSLTSKVQSKLDAIHNKAREVCVQSHNRSTAGDTLYYASRVEVLSDGTSRIPVSINPVSYGGDEAGLRSRAEASLEGFKVLFPEIASLITLLPREDRFELLNSVVEGVCQYQVITQDIGLVQPGRDGALPPSTEYIPSTKGPLGNEKLVHSNDTGVHTKEDNDRLLSFIDIIFCSQSQMPTGPPGSEAITGWPPSEIGGQLLEGVRYSSRGSIEGFNETMTREQMEGAALASVFIRPLRELAAKGLSSGVERLSI